VAAVVGVGDEAKCERERGERERPAVDVERRLALREADVGEAVVEVPSVRFVDGPAVLDALGDHEARVEDRHGEDDERECEGDQRVRLQRALDGDHREQVAEQVGARVAEEDRRGVEAVPQVAERGAGRDHREHAGDLAVERQRYRREGTGCDRADARGQPVDPVDEVHDIHERDDPEHGQHVRLGRREADVVDERKREALHAHAARHGHHRGEELADQLEVGR
jgi:hypothetical protein